MGKMRRFKHEIRSVNGKALAFDIRNGFGATLSSLFERIARGRVDDAEIREMFGTADKDEADVVAKFNAGPQRIPSAKAGKYTAMVSLHGVALYDFEWQPYAFSTSLLAVVMEDLANDPAVDTIILDINTPGGHVTGTKEAADAVWKARQKKDVIGIVNPLCASAGYWIGSQCTKLIGVPSADIGSIGVFMCHYDCSAMLADAGIKPTFIFAGEYKTEGNAMEPLGEDAKAWFQSEVNDTYQQFLEAVARGRGITAVKVFEKFGKGRCYSAPMAKKVGMIDEISTVRVALKNCGVSLELQQDTGRRRGEEQAPEQGAEAASENAAETAENAAPQVDEAAAAAEAAYAELMAGVEPCTFINVCSPGVVSTYAAQPWPAKAAIWSEFLAGTPEGRFIHAAGDLVTIAVANGAAVYAKIGETLAGDWVCKLEPNSSYEPMPEPKSTWTKPAGLSSATIVVEGAGGGTAGGGSGTVTVGSGGGAGGLVLEPSDEFKAEAAADADRRKIAEAARRRLAVLSA